VFSYGVQDASHDLNAFLMMFIVCRMMLLCVLTISCVILWFTWCVLWLAYVSCDCQSCSYHVHVCSYDFRGVSYSIVSNNWCVHSLLCCYCKLSWFCEFPKRGPHFCLGSVAEVLGTLCLLIETASTLIVKTTPRDMKLPLATIRFLLFICRGLAYFGMRTREPENPWFGNLWFGWGPALVWKSMDLSDPYVRGMLPYVINCSGKLIVLILVLEGPQCKVPLCACIMLSARVTLCGARAINVHMNIETTGQYEFTGGPIMMCRKHYKPIGLLTMIEILIYCVESTLRGTFKHQSVVCSHALNQNACV